MMLVSMSLLDTIQESRLAVDESRSDRKRVDTTNPTRSYVVQMRKRHQTLDAELCTSVPIDQRKTSERKPDK